MNILIRIEFIVQWEFLYLNALFSIQFIVGSKYQFTITKRMYLGLFSVIFFIHTAGILVEHNYFAAFGLLLYLGMLIAIYFVIRKHQEQQPTYKVH